MPAVIEQQKGAGLIGVIRYARIWKDRQADVECKDAFFDALEAAPVIDKPVASVALAIETTALKAHPRRPRATRTPRPALRPALAA